MASKTDETAELLFQAIYYKNVDLLRELIEANPGILVQAKTSTGQSPLHYAAIHGADECISVLCQNFDVDAVSGIADTLKTPLLLATEAGHLEVVKELVKWGADLFYLDANGYSALQLAQIRNYGRIAEYLFEKIDSLRRESDQLRQELCKACAENNYDQVLNILAKSSSSSRVRREVLSPGKQDHEKPALFIACEKGHHEIVGALLTVSEHYAMDPASGDTVLHAAVRSKNPQTVSLILDVYGKQMDMLNNEKSLPLHLACELGNIECLKLLLSHNYPSSMLNLYEKTINGLSYEFACNLNLVDGQCRTALHLAVEHKYYEIVEWMLRMRLPLYRTDEVADQIVEQMEIGSPFLLDTYAVDGRTPLMTSVCNRQQNVAELLLANSADINLPRAITDLEVANLAAEEARCVGSGTLIEAARANDLDFLRMLFFYGAVDYDNQALKKAARTENPQIISTFLDQLTFADQSNRINASNSRDIQLSAMDRLKSLDLLGSLRPTIACRLDWHNADLRQLTVESIFSATLRLNPRVRNQKIALTAITRIDLSDNQLQSLPAEIFQLVSLKTLNLDRNKLDELPIQSRGNEQGCPCLETLSAESNQLIALPDMLFDLRFFPQIRSLNLSHNKLKRLPYTLWRSSALRELNCSYNEIADLQAAQPRAREAGRQPRNPYIAAAKGARREIDRRGQVESGSLANGEGKMVNNRRPSVPITKVDVLRTNIWQNELNVAPLDDTEDPTPSDQQSERGQIRTADNSTNSIRTLNLSNNKLQSIPDCLSCYCPKVTKLDLSNNHISTLRCVECLPVGLKHLNLANNYLNGLFKRADAAALHCYNQMESRDQTAPANSSTSVNRHSRSRSKSVARNQQRSLSIIRASKEHENTELCSHKLHCRLENLKTLSLANNQLTSLELFIPFEAREEHNIGTKEGNSQNWKDQQLRSYLIFPVLTNLDLSNNSLKILPANVALLSQLAVLNLNENRGLERLPVELGLLEKLWSVSVLGCSSLKEPLKSVVGGGNFKTMDLLSYLRNELDNSKPYTKLKLMLLGRSEVGKTSLLSQLRQEGQVPKGSLQTDSWSIRLGHQTKSSSKSGTNANGFKNSSKLVDIAEWVFEPPRSSTKSSNSATKTDGPITFRTWDFDRLQKDFQQIPHYFLTRRSICLVVWKVTDGEIALNEIHEWLLAIHARAPNSTVIIVGTHLDSVEENIQRFPDNYLENLERIIQQKFVNIADSEKKGLPKVVALTFVSVKTRYNIQHLCQLIYYAAQQIKTPGRRTKLLQDKVPASFLQMEKIVAQMTDEFRARNEEPILTIDKLWTQVNNEFSLKLQASNSSPKQLDLRSLFRDRSEFRQACTFLHENGVLLMFEDTSLREYCFIDPPWLYTILRTILVQPHKSSTSLASISIGSGMAIVGSNDLFKQLKANLAERRIKFSLKHSKLKSCLFALLSRCETALPCFKRMLLVSPLLPDEYLLRADYPDSLIYPFCKDLKIRLANIQLFKNAVYFVGRFDGYLGFKCTENEMCLHSKGPTCDIININLGAELFDSYSYDGIISLNLDTHELTLYWIVPTTTTPIKLVTTTTRQIIFCSHSLMEICIVNRADTSNSLTAMTIEGGARIKTRTKVWRFRVKASANINSAMDLLSSRSSARLASHNRLQRQLGYYKSMPNAQSTSLQTTSLLTSQNSNLVESSNQEEKGKLEFHADYKDTYRRLFLMQYVPVGFWPRLTTRILNDEKLCNTIGELFVWDEDVEPGSARALKLTNDCALFNELNEALNSSNDSNEKPLNGGFEFLLWQSGLECNLQSNYLFSLKQFLPLANVRDTNYSVATLNRRSEDLVWRPLDIEDQFIVELLVPLIELKINWKSQDYLLKTCPKQATKLLASLVGIIDDLLEDWFPVLGTRFIHSSDGQLLVDRLIPCAECALKQIGDESDWRRKRKPSDPAPKTPVYLFSVEECILSVHQRSHSNIKPIQPPLNECPLHEECDFESLAPDINFNDLASDAIFDSAQIKRGKLLGKGAFGCVFSGAVKFSWNDTYEEVALKILESTFDSQSPVRQNFISTNTSDRLETIARSYCVARQELNLLGDLQHANITVLLGFSRAPLTLLMELAPHGALDQLLSRYKRSELRLSWPTIQHTCSQIAKALEYLHLNHIIYRDLKSENVLVWRFPQPHQQSKPTSNGVRVKLGDYGISRFTYPSDVCKGYGGTEGFMAPEILRFNGEFEYTDKVDCYSFGMFIYELISLRQPYDGQEQMKDCIFEGQRPFVTEKDILCPSNVLDLMVTCWADSASNRPSSSELVTICTAPEFTNLSDVALLTSNELATVSTIIKVEEDGPLNEHPLQCWLSRPDGLCTVLSFNEFGFVENEQIGPLRSPNITALAAVCGKIWAGSADGEITIFCPLTFAEQASFHLDILHSGPGQLSQDNRNGKKAQNEKLQEQSTHSKTIRSIFVCSERRAALITCPNAVLLLKVPPNALLPQHLATVCSDDFIHMSVIVRSANDWNIWTAHDDSRIVMHHIAGSSNRLLYSASAIHKGVPEAKRVKFLVSSGKSYGHAYSALENDGRVFMWQNGVVWRTLDCSKILPVSESLSSMFQDHGDENQEDELNESLGESQKSRISALNIYSNVWQVEQLLVGTSNGVLIVLECKTLSPLTSFRTYASAVETILCANFQSELIITEEQEGPKSEQQKNATDGSFFLTIGQKYRNLIKRLASNVTDSTDPIVETEVEKISYAVVWQGDNWQ